MKNTIAFKHSGFMGDIIYALPAIKQICEETNMKADLYVFMDKTWENFDDVGRGHKGLIDSKGLNFIAPLLQALPHINKVAMWKGEKIAVDLDRVKAMGQQIGLPHSHISRWYGYAYPELSTDKLHHRTIDLMDIHAYEVHSGIQSDYSWLGDKIVVNRSTRNLNPYINYVFLYNYPVIFVGHLNEYEAFREQVPNAEYLPCENALHLALIIGHSRLFIGNQSMPFAIAEQMKIPRLLEAYSSATNVIPIGDGGHDFYTQQGLEYLTEKLYNRNGKSNDKLPIGEADLH